MSQIIDLLLTKETLFPISKDLILIKDIKINLQVLNMFFHGFAVDQHIIKENQNELSKIGSEDFIHECLKRGRRVC